MPSTAPRITVHHNHKSFGPYSLEQTNSLLVAGRLNPDDLAWLEGTPEWTSLANVPGIVWVPPAPRRHPTARADPDASEHLILPAFLLAFFVGMFGIHRFYVGKVGSGIAMLILTLTMAGAVVTFFWSLIDWIIIVSGNFRDAEDKLLKRWT